MSKAVVSIIVPIYNGEKYLSECIDSILSQSFTEMIEIILVDDGSNDNSYAICKNYQGKHNNIKVIHQRNGGVTCARKNGVAAASGYWISFVDADDTLPTDAIGCMLEACANKDTDIVVGCMSKQSLPSLNKLDDCRYAMILGRNILPSLWGKLYKKNLFDDFIFDIPRQLTKGEDQLMNIRILFKTEKMPVFLCKNVYNYRRNIDSLSHKTKSSIEGAVLYHNVRLLSIPQCEQDKYMKATIFNRLNGLVGFAYSNPECICNKSTPFMMQLKEDIEKSRYKMNLQEWLLLNIRHNWTYKCVSFIIVVKNFLQYRLGLNR